MSWLIEKYVRPQFTNKSLCSKILKQQFVEVGINVLFPLTGITSHENSKI
jgi:hypothetical protein